MWLRLAAGPSLGRLPVVRDGFQAESHGRAVAGIGNATRGDEPSTPAESFQETLVVPL